MSLIASWFERHRIEAGIFLLAFVFRLALLGINMHFTSSNIEGVVSKHDGYYEKNLLDGNGFSRALRPPFVPDPLRTPLYPLFVAAILALFQSFWAMALIQILVGSVIPVLGMRIAHRIVPLKTMVTLVGVLLAVEPLSVLYSFVFYTETLFILLFFLFLLVFLDYLAAGGAWRIAGSSLLLGLATLTKPTVQYLPVCAAVVLAYFAFTTSINGFGVNNRLRMPVNVFIAFAVCSILGAEQGWGKVKANQPPGRPDRCRRDGPLPEVILAS